MIQLATMPQNTRPISILLETGNTELCRLLDQAPPGKPPQVLPAPNSDITHRSRVPQIDYSKDYCVHNICQEYPKNTNLCGTNSCKTNYTCSPRCIRAQRQGCVRLVQPSPSLSGDRASPKAIPDTKYSVVTISHKINTMTFLRTRSEKGRQFATTTFMGRQRLQLWNIYPLDE